MSDADRHVVDAVEKKEAVLEFEALFLLADVVDDAEHLLVGVRHQVVRDEEAPHGDESPTMISGLVICTSDMPADFMASSS